MLARAALKDAPGFEDVKIAFDPGKAALTLTGNVADASTRREADRRLLALWFLAAVEIASEREWRTRGALSTGPLEGARSPRGGCSVRRNRCAG